MKIKHIIKLLTLLAVAVYFASCSKEKIQIKDPAAQHEEDNGHNHEGHSHGEVAENDEGIIELHKEQQEMLGVQVSTVTRRTLYENIPALGEIKAAQFAEADVFAPFDGVLMPDPEHGVVQPGEHVTKGEVLARMAPSGGSESGWTQLANEYRLAKSEYERVQRLAPQGAVSERRLQEATLDYENKRARLQAILGGADIDSELEEDHHFHLRASRSGVLADIHLRYGQRVEAGERLWSIIDPSVVWLEAQLPASEAANAERVHDAYFTISGTDTILRVSELNGRLISASIILDPVTRRLPIIFELENRNGLLKPGLYAQVYLKTQKSHDAIAIPEVSVLNEEGSSVVYVQATEELFEKRMVRTGIKDDGFIEIISGLNEGERVVSKEAYKVRLASVKIGASDSHGHSH